MVILKIIKNIIRKSLMGLKNFVKYIRAGGVVYVNVSQIQYGGILKGKKVVVTGGSSGIGYAIARKCINEGAEVLITGRQIDKLKEAKRKINSELCEILEWDVGDSKIAKTKIDEAKHILNGIDIFINNAGVYKGEDFFDIEEKGWNTIMDINIKGLYFVTQRISEYYLKNKIKGKIINIASIAGLMGGCSPYWISKWGVIGLTKGLGMRLAPNGIIVNGIAPGNVSTPMTNININENGYFDRAYDKRVAIPEEIAEIAVFLASNAANHIVGQTIVCDGGESLN